ncbi:MAG: glycosyltransferase family 4 protein [Bacteroidetes bacterium]|nr:glycosyltransferase family 4 protein [Bacteroidota bacterium]
MNILLINHYAGSSGLGMEFRPYYLGKEWVRAGHHVTIISASYAHVRRKQPMVSKDFSEEFISGIRYVWIKTPKYDGNGLRRVMNMIVFVIKLWISASRISKKFKPDVVIASSTYPLDNYPAYRIALKSGAQYAYEVHDLWPLSPMELGGYSKHHPFIRIMQAAENFAYKNVNLVISMLPNTLQYMQGHGLDSGKWHYIPNGINPEEWEKESAIPEKHVVTLKNIKDQGHKIIGYTGSIGIANALENLISAAALLTKDKISFVITGVGPEKVRLEKQTIMKGVGNVFFLDPVLKKQMPALLDRFDILYIGLQKQSLFRFGISPNKLLDYMMAAKPVIQAIDAGNDMVGEAGCGISLEPENPEKLTEAIKTILSYTDDERAILGAKGREYVLKHHNYIVLADRMISIFNDSLKST